MKLRERERERFYNLAFKEKGMSFTRKFNFSTTLIQNFQETKQCHKVCIKYYSLFTAYHIDVQLLYYLRHHRGQLMHKQTNKYYGFTRIKQDWSSG